MKPKRTVLWTCSNPDKTRVVAERLTATGRLVEIRLSGASEPVLEEDGITYTGVEAICYMLDGRRKNNSPSAENGENCR